MRPYIALIIFLLVGCIMDPEKKKVTVINVDCRNSLDYVDSAGVAHYSCPINDPGPPGHP